MPEQQISLDPIRQRKLEEFVKNQIEMTGFDPSVMKYYGIELSPEDLSALRQIQKINQDIERWKKTGWLTKLWHHTLGTFTFGLYSNNAPPPEIAEKEGGLLYKQADFFLLKPLNEIYKFLFSDYGLSFAGLAEGLGFLAQIPIGTRLLGLAGRGEKALGFLERLGIDKVIEEEIRNPLIRDGFYKWLHKSNTNKFIWDSFKLGLAMAPWAGYGAVREMRWAGESPTLSDWIEGTAKALPVTIVAAGPAMTLMGRGIAKGWNRYQAWKLLDKRLGTLAQEAERVIGTAIDDEAGRKAIRTIDEFIRDINDGLHNKGILEKISDFSPENIGNTHHNLGILRQSLETFVKTSPERMGLLYDTLDALKDIPYFQKIKGVFGDNFSRFMDNVKELKRFSEMIGDDLGLQYLFKNPEELLAVKDKIPELSSKLIKSIENIDDFLRKELYGKFIPEMSERIFGKEGQSIPVWSFSALKNWLQSMGLVHQTSKDFSKVSNITRQQLAYELFNRPELLEALSYIAPETMGNILSKRNEIFDKLVKLFDEELLPLWKQLPNDIKEILNEKAKTELLKGEELGTRIKFNLDENLNFKNVEEVIRQSPQQIEKTLGQRISNVFDWSNMENVKKFVENEIRPRYGEALAQWEEIPEKTQEFLSNVQTLLRYGGVETIKEWLSKKPALDEVVDLTKKIDRMSVDPLGQDLIEFLGQYSFIGKRLAENRATRIANSDKLRLLKGVFASGITDEERVLSFSYRVFDSREAQTLFVNQYVNAYINGTLSEFLDRQYPVIYNFLKKAIPSLPKEYSIDNFINAMRAIQDDATRMRIEATVRNGGIDPFVSKKEFLEQFFRVNQHDFVKTIEATKEAKRELAQEVDTKKLQTKSSKRNTSFKEKKVKPETRSDIKESSPMNLTVSPTFKVLEQFLGKDVNEIYNKLVSYLENTGFFEDPSKLNLTELSQIMPKISKKIADIEFVPLTFRGKMFNIDTKNTFQEKKRIMVNLVGLTGDKETIPITKEFALWLKYIAKTIENIEGKRPTIEEIIGSLEELFTKGGGEI